MSVSLTCSQHPNVLAGWTCGTCGASLCPRCAYRRQAGQGTLIVCGSCGGMATTIMARRAPQTFVALIPGAFVYPFSQAGLITMALLGVVLSLLSLLGGMPALIGNGAFVSYLFLVIRTTASGYPEVPESEDFNHVWDLLEALFRFLVAMAISALPLALYVHFVKEGTPLVSYLKDPIVYVALLTGVLLSPMACMQAATNSPILSIMNPIYTLAYIGRVPGDYAVAAFMFWLLMFSSMVVVALGLVLQSSLPIPLLPQLYTATVAIYPPLVSARILGLLLFARGAELGYGATREYLEPALGDAEPELEPAFVTAPVETMREANKGFQSFSSLDANAIQTMNEPAPIEPIALEDYGGSTEIMPIASTSNEDDYTPGSLSESAPSEEQTADRHIRALAESGRFDLVAAAYRDRLGVVSVLTAEQLRQTAEAARAADDLETSTHALRRLAHDFPADTQAPEALLEAGTLLIRQLGQPDEGRTLLSHLVEAYPLSLAAEKGRELLEGVG